MADTKKIGKIRRRQEWRDLILFGIVAIVMIITLVSYWYEVDQKAEKEVALKVQDKERVSKP